MHYLHPYPAKRIVGIVGGAASGKNTVADLFADAGYEHVSSSDVLREEVYRRYGTTSRELQTKVGNKLRATHGVGYWVDASIDRLTPESSHAVISGLYSPGEAQYFVAHYGGLIVGVVCLAANDTDARFARLKARSDGARDALSREDFLAAHQRENGGTAAYETNIAKILEIADYIIQNTADLAYLRSATGEVLETINRRNA